MRRTKAEAAATRAHLLKTALRVFSAKGYAATTIDDLVSAAGLTRGALYWHFKSKADLYNTLVQEFSARGAHIVQEAVAEGGSLLEILRRVFVRQLALIEDDADARAIMELALFKTGTPPELNAGRKKQIEAGHQLIENLAQAMARGVASGELRADLAPQDLARSFIAFQNGLIQLWLWAPKSFSLKAQAESSVEVLLAGLQAH